MRYIYFTNVPAYYGSASFGSGGVAGMSSHADYTSYYSNYMAAAAGSFYGSSGKSTSTKTDGQIFES